MAHPVEEGSGAPSFRPLWALMPYLWPADTGLRWRVFIALFCMVLGIIATTIFPIFIGQVTNELAKSPAQIMLFTTLALVGAYVVARILMQTFAQLRDGVFAKVQYHAMRVVGVETFAHVHTLSLRFHLERKTGGLSRVIERGTKGIDNLLSFALFSIFPTLFQLLIFSGIMALHHGGQLHHLHARGHGMAQQVPPRDECHRQRGDDQGGRQPAQL